MKRSQHDEKCGWYVVGVLVLAYTFSFVDRQILSLLVEPMKRDLEITDTQISLLIGLSFALFYAVLGLPIGRLIDAKSRTRIIVWGIVIWSLMTAGCGLVRHYWQLFLARIGVGVGEAALSPAAYSLIADYFPREKRGLAMSVYNVGAPAGGALAMIIGGLVVQHLSDWSPVAVPLIGTIYPWQLVFVAVGVPGLLVALLFVLTVKEPPRQELLQRDAGLPTSSPSVPLRELFSHVKRHRKTLTCHNLGFALSAMTQYAISAWVPTFLIRTFGWPVGKVGLYFGITLVVAGTLGVVCGGWFSDWLTRKGYQDSRMRVGLISVLLALAPAVVYPLVDTPALSLALLGMTIFMLTFPMGSGPAGLQEIFPNQMRGQVSALYLFILNIFGLALGPTVVAVMTDYWFQDPLAVRYSLAAMAAGTLPVAIFVFWLGLKPFQQSVDYFQRSTATSI